MITRTLLHGAVLSVLASALLIFSMWINPRLYLQDYPPEIQASVPPKTAKEKRLGLVVGIPFLLLLLGVPLVSTLALKHELAQVPFLALLANAFGIGFVFNAVDWLILDWWMFCTMTPRFLVIAGSEGMAAYKDYSYHFRGFLIGTVISAVGGLIIAALAWFL